MGKVNNNQEPRKPPGKQDKPSGHKEETTRKSVRFNIGILIGVEGVLVAPADSVMTVKRAEGNG